MENKNLTILVVEDEQHIRELVAATLRKDGFHVLEASDPHTAVEMVGSHLFNVDLLFTDVVMPNMNGNEFAKEMLAMRPKLKIVFATGSNQDEMKAELAKIPHHYFLEKPYTADDLRKAVKTALEKS